MTRSCNWAGLTALIPLLLLVACSGIRMPKFDAILESQAPPAPEARAQMVQQRWLLPRGGIDLAFTLYVEVQPPNDLQFVALDDFGTTMAQGSATAVTDASRAVPTSIADRIRTLLVALYLPGDRHAVRVRASGVAGWHDLTRNSLRTATELHVDGMRAKFEDDGGGMVIEGALEARVAEGTNGASE
jgi:hypothetical protein